MHRRLQVLDKRPPRVAPENRQNQLQPSRLHAPAASSKTDIHLKNKSIASSQPPERKRRKGGGLRARALPPPLHCLRCRHNPHIHVYSMYTCRHVPHNIRGRYRLFFLFDNTAAPPASGACMGTSFSAFLTRRDGASARYPLASPAPPLCVSPPRFSLP